MALDGANLVTFKRKVLSALKKESLLAIAKDHELTASARMSADKVRDVVAKSKKVDVESILGALSRNDLKKVCAACELDDIGREKADLVARILAAASGKVGSDGARGESLDPDKQTGKQVNGSSQLGLDLESQSAPLEKASVAALPRRKRRVTDRRRAGLPDSVAAEAGSVKAALRQFALGAAGGYSGRAAAESFTTHLLECFGWQDGRPEGADVSRKFAVAQQGARADREIALWWAERRTAMDVVAHDANLAASWKDTLQVCLQIVPQPQYVVLTNQRDLQLFDLARDREAPRLAIPIDDLPKYSEAFPFFTREWVPGTTPKIINVEKVSTEVADLVARLYRSVRAQHPAREQDVIRFVLQCITAMFAEDIGLLPKNHFTSILYDGARNRNIDEKLRELFVQMNTADLPESSGPRVVPYFNGGLFTDIPTLSLGGEQIVAMTKAAEANWTYVDPHIFGSVFQGVMNDAERHASGAHYTAHDDIMRVVGPTIVEPWRKRIQAAKSLAELSELRKELFRFRVLDPACGSGNFLYVAFRELYRLDTELLSRMREFPSMHGKLKWAGGIAATNFFGIDINPFAVELAKVTLNIAKKIAFEERKAQAVAWAGQVEIDVDPSLPLDNLDKNIVCADALFTDWPEVEAIVGNPPFLGGAKIRAELGDVYLRRLLQRFSNVNGNADLCAYWFRCAHDRLQIGRRAGLVATSGIRVGSTREASLDYIVANTGTITHAVSSMDWPGAAAVGVSMINWVKAIATPPYRLVVENMEYLLAAIPTHLQLYADVTSAGDILANGEGTTAGLVFGHAAFRSGGVEGFVLTALGQLPCIRPVATGDDLLRSRLTTEPEYFIDLRDCATEAEAKAAGGAAFEHLRMRVFPSIKARADSDSSTGHYKNWLRYWWKPQGGREDFVASIKKQDRLLVCSRVAARPAFAFVSGRFVANNTLQMFTPYDDYSFGIMQASPHWQWTKAQGGKVTERIRYTTDVWRTFPWPQDPTDNQVSAVVAASRELRRVRDELMTTNGWSLRQLYQAAEVAGPHPLNDAQAALDVAVNDAYGMPPGQDSLEFLLELNQLVAEDETAGRKVRGPGLPDHLDPKDPRWTSTDCVEPPKMEK
jgi:SAM-dependent methyltransferase